MGRRGMLVVAVGVAVLVPSVEASASVLVAAPFPFKKDCGERIELGVWYREDGQRSARKVTMAIRTRSGRLVWRKRVRASSSWRYWRYRPTCGRRYVVRYRNAVWGVQKYKGRVRSS